MLKLCLDLGKLPDELEESLTAAELQEFVAFYKLQAEAEKKAYDDAAAKAKAKRR